MNRLRVNSKWAKSRGINVIHSTKSLYPVYIALLQSHPGIYLQEGANIQICETSLGQRVNHNDKWIMNFGSETEWNVKGQN